MGKAARSKGKRGELEVRAILHERGLIGVERVPNSGGLRWKGDVKGWDGMHVEVKRQERLDLPAALRQAREEAEAGEVPLVVHRSSRERWKVTLDFDHFLDLVLRDVDV